MRKYLLGLGFLLFSASVLILEIVSARYSRIVFMFEFQFIIISFTIWGLGIGGLLTYIFYRNSEKKRVGSLIILYSVVYLFLILVSFLSISGKITGFDSLVKATFFLSSLLAYISAGIVTSLVFRYHTEQTSLLYGFSLIGGAFGAVATSLLLNSYGNSMTIFVLLFVALISSLFFALAFGNAKKVLVALLVGGIIFLLGALRFPDVFYANCGRFETKIFQEDQRFALRKQKEVIVDSNSFSQLDILLDGQNGGLNDLFTTIRYDCTAVTILPRSGKSPDNFRKELLSQNLSFPLTALRPKNLAVVGSGGGIDVLRAIHAGVKHIDAVEINPLTIKWVYKLDPHNMYTDNRVRLTVGEGRGTVAKAKKTYDMIYLPGAERFGDIGIAPYAFVSNYLYTEEAIATYFDKVQKNGWIALADPALFVDRYAQAVAAYFIDKGLKPEDHIVFVTGKDTMVNNRSIMLVKKSRMTDAERVRLRDLANSEGLKFTESDIPLTRRITDDHPFFWNLGEITHTPLVEGPVASELQDVVYRRFFTFKDLFFSLTLLLSIFAATIGIPFLLSKKLKQNIGQVAPLLIYFSGLGAGYIILELFTLEKATFFLGSPIYSLSVVLSSFLLWSGVGSILSRKIRPTAGTLKRLGIACIILILAYACGLYGINSHLGFLPLPAKIALLSILMAAPIGVAGMLFPLGLTFLSRDSKEMIPWMWGIDAIASVLGGIIFIITALAFGFKWTLVVGIIMYGMSLCAIYLIPHKR